MRLLVDLAMLCSGRRLANMQSGKRMPSGGGYDAAFQTGVSCPMAAKGFVTYGEPKHTVCGSKRCFDLGEIGTRAAYRLFGIKKAHRDFTIAAGWWSIGDSNP